MNEEKLKRIIDDSPNIRVNDDRPHRILNIIGFVGLTNHLQL
jgi:hypothetical protein